MRARLALTAAAVTTMIVLAFSIPLARLVQTLAERRALDAAKLESRSLGGAISAVTGQPVAIAQLVDQANAGNPRPITLYLPDGAMLGNPIPIDAEVELARKGRSFSAPSRTGGRDVFVGVATASSRVATVVRVHLRPSLLNEGVAKARAVVVAIGLAVVVIAVILADSLARSVLGPMSELLAVTRRLQQGDLGARVDPGGPAEVFEVGVAVNGLADQVGVLLAAEREATADLSHQLRTPLTALRLDAEGLESERDRARLAGDVDRLERVVTDAIQESRSHFVRAGTPTKRGTCDLGRVVRDRLGFWSILAADQGRDWSMDVAPAPSPVGVSQRDIEVGLDSLLNNVFTHTPVGARFSVTVATGAGRSQVLTVEDAGPGLAGGAVPARGTSGGSGTGLGLDIVRRTAEASGGHLTAGWSRLGGARIEVTYGPQS